MLFITATILEELALLSFTLLVSITAYYKWSFTYWKKRNVHHLPPTMPFGNIPNPFNRKQHFGDTIADVYNELKSKGERYGGLYIFAMPSLIPICPEYVRLFTTKEFQSFPNRSLFYNEKDDPISGHLLSLNGEKWRILRTKLTPAFSSGKIKMMYKILVECAQGLLDVMESPETKTTNVDIKKFLSTYTSDVIASCAFGLELNTTKNSNSDFHEFGRRALEFSSWRCTVLFLSSLFPKLSRVIGVRQVDKECGDFFVNIVKKTVQHREENNLKRKDFLQLLIDIKNNDPSENHTFTIEELAAQCFIFFIAGHETSATTMAFTLFEIAYNPEIGHKIRKEIASVLVKHNNELTYDAIMEMKYLHQVIEETLRKYPPSYYVTRICTSNYTIPETNVVIEKGTQVTIPIAAIHRDPDYYPDPEKFDPDRFNEENRQFIKRYTYLPFGEGPRNCIGMRFGLLQTKVALATILMKYNFTINPKTIVPLKMKPSALLLEVEGDIWLDYEKL